MDLSDFKNEFSSFDPNPIGAGGQKIVYLGVHKEYGPVVIKRIIRWSERVAREISLVDNLKLDNVPKIYKTLEVDWEGDSCQVVIEERIYGKELSQLISEGTRYNLEQLIDFLQQGLAFIKQIASQNVVHRDIKPENIIMTPSGEYVFIDFGIARDLSADSLTQSGAMSPNTPGYGAPELIMGEKENIDERTDMFSLGVVAYELASGENPFRKSGQNRMQIWLSTITITPLDFRIEGDVHFEVMGLISSLMSRERFKRPQDAVEALDWLDNIKTNLELS